VRIYTVGHGTRSLEELAGLLTGAGVATLVDVRRHPGSRRSPHLARESLAEALPRFGVAYAFRGDALGGRRSEQKPTRHPAWINASFRGYADYMDTPAFAAALAELEASTRDGGPLVPPLALLCAETLWWRCHRRLIADVLTLHGFEVVHLLAPGKGQAHALNPALRVGADGRPVYDLMPEASSD
jgi:uncharacterized protein (DUF488 family)